MGGGGPASGQKEGPAPRQKEGPALGGGEEEVDVKREGVSLESFRAYFTECID